MTYGTNFESDRYGTCTSIRSGGVKDAQRLRSKEQLTLYLNTLKELAKYAKSCYASHQEIAAKRRTGTALPASDTGEDI